MNGPDDTIAAVCTAAGGGIGVIRMSGPDARAIALRHFRGLGPDTPARTLVHGWWCDAEDASLDEGLCVVMPRPHSYTGEDVVELHLHGGSLGLRRSLEVCLEAGARLAEPGEFTRRAFLAGKMDLTRAEAVADVIDAQTDRGLAQARLLLRGGLTERVEQIRGGMLTVRAALEANIDFVDEDIPPVDPVALTAALRAQESELGELARTWQQGRLLRDGARVVLTGAPNAGKSSLFNALSRSDRVIVTPVPGTTRDTVEETIDMGGVPVVLVDTAGLRDTEDVVESAGIARTLDEARAADLVIHLIDPSSSIDPSPPPQEARCLVVSSKADLPHDRPVAGRLRVSARTGEGLAALESAILEMLGAHLFSPKGLVITHERHQRGLMAAADGASKAAAGLEKGAPFELVAVDLQDGMDALAALVGLTTIEEVLDRLFATFCIGK